MYAKRTTGPVDVRVWTHIDRCEPSACWPWTASVDRGGYGQINDGKGRIRKAHQVVLEIAIGRPLAPGEWGLHHCDNPPCCNPAHLYIGDADDNYRDMIQRKRANFKGAVGEANCNAKLTDGDVQAILGSLDGRRGTQARLARQYGVTPTVILNIAKRRTWRHVTAPGRW
jgi:hypothetical protein